MRLSFRLCVGLGVLLTLFPTIQPALVSYRFSEKIPISQAPGSSVVFEHLTPENGISYLIPSFFLSDRVGSL